MARSKSPARAKSPGRKAAKAKAAPAAASGLGAHETQLGIALGVVVAAWFLGGGFEASPSALAKAAAGGFEFKYPAGIPAIVTNFIGGSCNLVFILHVFNCISSNRTTSGYFMNNFTQLNLATFAGVYVPQIMAGKSIFDNTFHDGPHFNFTSFFLAWYVVNYDIPFCPAKFGIWDKIAEFGGDALSKLLDFGTVMFTTNLVVAACAVKDPFTTAFFKTVVIAIVTGTAAEFFPFNKGIKFARSDNHYNAGAIAIFLCSNGFALIDFFVGIPLGIVGVAAPFKAAAINGIITNFFGGLPQFVVVVTIINFFFGEFIPMRTHNGFDLFGLTSKLFGLAQLNF